MDRVAKITRDGFPQTRRPLGRPPKQRKDSWTSISQENFKNTSLRLKIREEEEEALVLMEVSGIVATYLSVVIWAMGPLKDLSAVENKKTNNLIKEWQVGQIISLDRSTS